MGVESSVQVYSALHRDIVDVVAASWSKASRGAGGRSAEPAGYAATRVHRDLEERPHSLSPLKPPHYVYTLYAELLRQRVQNAFGLASYKSDLFSCLRYRTSERSSACALQFACTSVHTSRTLVRRASARVTVFWTCDCRFGKQDRLASSAGLYLSRSHLTRINRVVH